MAHYTLSTRVKKIRMDQERMGRLADKLPGVMNNSIRFACSRKSIIVSLTQGYMIQIGGREHPR
jgi:hypothetical protein